MFSSREGITLDSIAAPLRRVLLNPFITVPISLVVSVPSIWSGIHSHVFPTAAAGGPGELRAVAYILAASSVCYSLNEYLNRQVTNNWVDDPTWNWDEEIVVITGGSGGIGASISRQLLERNIRTRIVVVDYAPLSWTPPAKSRVSYFQCDLSDSKALKAICQRIRDEVGHPTVLFNNAGLVRGTSVMEGSYVDVEATVKTNLIAPMLVAKEFLPEMVRRDHGHIIHTGSLSCYTPPALIADYAATKAGLMALHEALQLELKHVHQSPRVRLTLGIFFFIRTPLVQGHPNTPNWLMPFIHVDSAGEKLVEAVYSGYGSTIFLPGVARYAMMLKGGPDWFFRLIRESTTSFQIDYTGRQKIDSETGHLQKA